MNPLTIEADLNEYDRSALSTFCERDVPPTGKVTIQIRDRADYDAVVIFLKMLGK